MLELCKVSEDKIRTLLSEDPCCFRVRARFNVCTSLDRSLINKIKRLFLSKHQEIEALEVLITASDFRHNTFFQALATLAILYRIRFHLKFLSQDPPFIDFADIVCESCSYVSDAATCLRKELQMIGCAPLITRIQSLDKYNPRLDVYEELSVKYLPHRGITFDRDTDDVQLRVVLGITNRSVSQIESDQDTGNDLDGYISFLETLIGASICDKRNVDPALDIWDARQIAKVLAGVVKEDTCVS